MSECRAHIDLLGAAQPSKRLDATVDAATEYTRGGSPETVDFCTTAACCEDGKQSHFSARPRLGLTG
jgi:hypothetical protein